MSQLHIRVVTPTDTNEVLKAGNFVQEHSWGLNYPLKARDFLAKADFLVLGHLIVDTVEVLTSIAAVTTYQGNPADPEDTCPYLCCLVTHPEDRKFGYGTQVYRAALRTARKRGFHTIHATTDSEVTTQFLVTRPRWYLWENPWTVRAPGLNEDRSPHVRLRCFLGLPPLIG